MLQILLLEESSCKKGIRLFNKSKYHYSVHEKELLAIVCCLMASLPIWVSIYLKSNILQLSHFMSQSKQLSKQVHCQELLLKFKFMLEYHQADSYNHDTDTLSWWADLDIISAMAALSRSEVTTNIKDGHFWIRTRQHNIWLTSSSSQSCTVLAE